MGRVTGLYCLWLHPPFLGMGGRGLRVRAGVAEVTELCPTVEVSLLCGKNSSNCVLHAGLRLSVVRARGLSGNRTGIQVTSRAGERRWGETHGKRARGTGPKDEATSGPWSKIQTVMAEPRDHRPGALRVLRSRDQRSGTPGLWEKPCSLRALTS